jgi:hypothetical protein
MHLNKAKDDWEVSVITPPGGKSYPHLAFVGGTGLVFDTWIGSSGLTSHSLAPRKGGTDNESRVV